MKQIDLKIPIYMWNLKIILIEGKKDVPTLTKVVNKYKLPDSKSLIDEIKAGGKEGGKTYTRKGSLDFIVMIFPHSSTSGFIRTLNHEKRHVVDDILEWQDVHDKEAAAYLDGYLSEELYKRLKTIKIL